MDVNPFWQRKNSIVKFPSQKVRRKSFSEHQTKLPLLNMNQILKVGQAQEWSSKRWPHRHMPPEKAPRYWCRKGILNILPTMGAWWKLSVTSPITFNSRIDAQCMLIRAVKFLSPTCAILKCKVVHISVLNYLTNNRTYLWWEQLSLCGKNRSEKFTVTAAKQ